MEEKVYEYLNRLVSVPGISDTDEERKTAEAIRYWLSTNVASEIRMGNWVCLLKKQRRECMDSRSVGWGRK